jgi:hypothetical protein
MQQTTHISSSHLITAEILLPVTVVDVENAPVLLAGRAVATTVTAQQGKSIVDVNLQPQYAPRFYDADGDVVSFLVTFSPPNTGLTYNFATRVIGGTPSIVGSASALVTLICFLFGVAP